MIATMLCFTQVERAKEGSAFVATGLAMAQRMSFIRARLSLVTLTFAMQQTLKEQADLISHLSDAGLKEFSPGELTDLAVMIEQLVARNQRIPAAAKRVTSRRWRGLLAAFTAQTERLDNLAEALRMASDQETQNYIASLAHHAEEQDNYQADFEWREFVASLQD